MSKAAFAGIALALTTAACHSVESPRTGVPLRELAAGNQCLVSGAELRLLDNAAEAQTLLGTHRLGAKPRPLNVDSDVERVLLVAAGRRPSAGYRLELTKHDAVPRDGVLHLPVNLSAPGQGYEAAVITSPCLLLAVRRGRYQRIVVDSLGLELDLPE